MQIVLRADTSRQIGIGHVMRCLTLADALRAEGAKCHFICREHPGNLIEYIRSKGYPVHSLPMCAGSDSVLVHGNWLGATQAQDATACAWILDNLRPDWLVVDHYALDVQWERSLNHYCRRLMVIDDLADREHSCQLLLDQTFERNANDYRELVPQHCKLLCGSTYALLRPEFAALRPYSLQRRLVPVLKQLLISLGGVDKDNFTCQVLDMLKSSPLPADCRIVVIMGSTAPWLADVKTVAGSLNWTTRVLVDVTNMAELMADSDLAIGAAGTTSWERCCLGVPSIILVTAENQAMIADTLIRAGAAFRITHANQFREQFATCLTQLLTNSNALVDLSASAAAKVDGEGVNRVLRELDSSYG
jgi:UDP-2,4-diacetamido-2,4,6-trideoxy-beta-L-altropyranose hydrolase